MTGWDDEREDGDPVAEAARLLGEDLQRFTDEALDDSLAGDASLSDGAFAADNAARVRDRATERAEPLVAIPVLDLDDEPEEATAAELRLPLPPLAGSETPAPLTGQETPFALPGRRTVPPPLPPRTPAPAPPLAPVARPVPLALPIARPVTLAVPGAAPVARPVVVPRARPIGPAAPTPLALPPKPSGPLPPVAPGTDPRARPAPSVVLDFGEDSEAHTEIFDAARPRELPRGRLVVVGGPDDGKTWYLNRPVTFLGRGHDNDVVLVDQSVSRRHLRIDRTAEGFSVTDEKAGNGTWINGARVRRDEIYDGDRLMVGDTTLLFSTVGLPRRRPLLGQVTDPGQRRPIAPRSELLPSIPRRWILAWIATTLVAVAVTVTAARVVRARRFAKARAAAEVHRLVALEAVQRRAWDAAREALQSAEALDPELLDYALEYQRLGAAVQDALTLDQARQALSAGDFGEAIARAGRIGEESPYGFDARMLRRQAEAALARPRPPPVDPP